MKKFLKWLFLGVLLLSYSENIFARKYFGVIPYYVTSKAKGSKVKLMLIKEDGIRYTFFHYSMVDRYLNKKSEDECLKFVAHNFCDNIPIFQKDFVLKNISYERSVVFEEQDLNYRVFFLDCTNLPWIISGVSFKMGVTILCNKTGNVDLFTCKKLQGILESGILGAKGLIEDY